MNEVLEKYFSKEYINKLLKNLNNKQRTNIINNNYFVKIGKNSNELFFNNLKKELLLYQNNKDNINLPKLIDYYLDDNICLIILEKIYATVLGKSRNKFSLYLSNKKRINIANSILKIKDIKINLSLDNSYNRKEKLDKYLEKTKNYINNQTYNNIISLKDKITKEQLDRVISHGDLISPNIMINEDKIYFIDWEYISLKPKYYDLVYFLLFSKKRHSIDLLYKMNMNKSEIEEALKDGIIICLKEISNNIKYLNNRNINRWKKELNYILSRIM